MDKSRITILRENADLQNIIDILDVMTLDNLRKEYVKRNLGKCSRMKRMQLTLDILEFELSEINEPKVEKNKKEICEPEVEKNKKEICEPEVKKNNGNQSRGWCYTLNNWTSEEYENLVEVECKFHVIGKEVGASGTPHLQGYIEFKNRGKRLGGLM